MIACSVKDRIEGPRPISSTTILLRPVPSTLRLPHRGGGLPTESILTLFTSISTPILSSPLQNTCKLEQDTQKKRANGNPANFFSPIFPFFCKRARKHRGERARARALMISLMDSLTSHTRRVNADTSAQSQTQASVHARTQ